MKMSIKKLAAVGALAGSVVIFSSMYAGTVSAKDKGGRRQGPPPEAYTACEGKADGDTASFESPRGDTVTGTCVQEGACLVLRPDNPPDRRMPGGRNE